MRLDIITIKEIDTVTCIQTTLWVIGLLKRIIRDEDPTRPKRLARAL